jgi:hypothetical protein
MRASASPPGQTSNLREDDADLARFEDCEAELASSDGVTAFLNGGGDCRTAYEKFLAAFGCTDQCLAELDAAFAVAQKCTQATTESACTAVQLGSCSSVFGEEGGIASPGGATTAPCRAVAAVLAGTFLFIGMLSL